MNHSIVFDNITQQLEAIKETQPNVYHLWKLYIHKKQTAYTNSLLECLTMLKTVKDIDKTLTITDLQTLLLLKKDQFS